MNLVGKTLGGRYQILEEIGAGGMAVVYKARCNVLHRFVAVKVLRPDLKDNKEFINRFRIEAQAAASLTHPNIVSIYDVGCDGDYNYIIMEYIQGTTLREYMDAHGKQLPWREAVAFAKQIAMGLEQAHKNSIIHRDIKPQNILMTPDGTLKVTDFGIARASVDQTMTYGSSAIGTVHYVSPEQARGGYTDERSDIYSLGIVLYEMLTGTVPFDHESPVTVAIKHLQEQPVPVRELCLSVPMAVEKIVMRMIDKDANMRPDTVGVLISSLTAVLENEGASPSGGTMSYDDDDSGKTMLMSEYDREAIRKKSRDGREGENSMRGRSRNQEKIDKKKEKKVIIAAIITAIVIIIGLCIGVVSFLGLGSFFYSGNNDIEVPDVVGMSFEEAKKKYEDSKFSIIKTDEIESTEEKGEIVEQDPKAGASVKNKETITINVSVSSGVKEIKIGDYTKYKDARKAEIEIEALGLIVDIIEEYSDTVPENTIIRQSPSASSTVEKNDIVTLYVSKGPKESEKTEEPDTNERSESKKNQTVVSPNKNSNNNKNTNTNTNTNTDTNTGNNNTSGNTSSNVSSGNNNSGSGTTNSASNNTTNEKKKSTMLTVYGPKNAESSKVQVKVNGKTVYEKNLRNGESDVVKLEGNTSQIEVEILYDGVSTQKQTVTLY